MQVIHLETGSKKNISIELIAGEDLKKTTKARYFFNWKSELKYDVFKLSLVDNNEILGLMSLAYFEDEKRVEIKLLAVSQENRGKNKLYEGIVGNLIAHACRQALRLHAEDGCVSLIPKTELKKHYIKEYGMTDAGWQIFVEREPLLKLIQKYKI